MQKHTYVLVPAEGSAAILNVMRSFARLMGACGRSGLPTDLEGNVVPLQLPPGQDGQHHIDQEVFHNLSVMVEAFTAAAQGKHPWGRDYDGEHAHKSGAYAAAFDAAIRIAAAAAVNCNRVVDINFDNDCNRGLSLDIEWRRYLDRGRGRSLKISFFRGKVNMEVKWDKSLHESAFARWCGLHLLMYKQQKVAA